MEKCLEKSMETSQMITDHEISEEEVNFDENLGKKMEISWNFH